MIDLTLREASACEGEQKHHMWLSSMSCPESTGRSAFAE